MSWATAAPVPLSVILLLLWAATSGYAGLCFRVLSSKWSLQVRPEIKRIRPWISAEKASEMEKKDTFCHTNSTGLLPESKHYLVNFRRAMLSRLLGLADHCIPPKPAKKIKNKIKWIKNVTQAHRNKWVFLLWLKIHLTYAESESCVLPGRAALHLSGQIQVQEWNNTEAGTVLMACLFAPTWWDWSFTPKSHFPELEGNKCTSAY